MNVLIDCIVKENSDETHFSCSGFFIDQITRMLPHFQFVLAGKSDFTASASSKNIDYLPAGSSTAFFNQFFQSIKLKNQLKKIKPNFVINSGYLPLIKNANNCFVIPSRKALVFMRSKRCKQVQTFFAGSFFIKQELIHSYNIDANKIIITPDALSSNYQPLSSEQKEKVKSQFTGNSEFLLINSSTVSETDLFHILKAFSFFKKRLQTNMKLLIPGLFPSNDKAVSLLLTHYKYKEDVLFSGLLTVEQSFQISAAAYAVIHITLSKEEFTSAQKIIQYGVPMLVLQPEPWEQHQNYFLYASPLSVEDLSQKLMLLYKDETYRKKIISNGQQLLPFFSETSTAKVICDYLLHTAVE